MNGANMNMNMIRVNLGSDFMPDGRTPLKNIKKFSAADVLCGRGGGTNHHTGNNHWRALVSANKRLYISLPKKQKVLVAKSIVHAIRSQTNPHGGRILQKDTESGLWNDIGDHKATEKTSQALREGAPDIRSEMEQEKALAEQQIVAAPMDAMELMALSNRGALAGNNAAAAMMMCKPGQILPNGLITLEYEGVHTAVQRSGRGPLQDGTMDVNLQYPQMIMSQQRSRATQNNPKAGGGGIGGEGQNLMAGLPGMPPQMAATAAAGGDDAVAVAKTAAAAPPPPMDPMMQAFQKFMGGAMSGSDGAVGMPPGGMPPGGMPPAEMMASIMQQQTQQRQEQHQQNNPQSAAGKNRPAAQDNPQSSTSNNNQQKALESYTKMLAKKAAADKSNNGSDDIRPLKLPSKAKLSKSRRNSNDAAAASSTNNAPKKSTTNNNMQSRMVHGLLQHQPQQQPQQQQISGNGQLGRSNGNNSSNPMPNLLQQQLQQQQQTQLGRQLSQQLQQQQQQQTQLGRQDSNSFSMNYRYPPPDNTIMNQAATSGTTVPGTGAAVGMVEPTNLNRGASMTREQALQILLHEKASKQATNRAREEAEVMRNGYFAPSLPGEQLLPGGRRLSGGGLSGSTLTATAAATAGFGGNHELLAREEMIANYLSTQRSGGNTGANSGLGGPLPPGAALAPGRPLPTLGSISGMSDDQIRDMLSVLKNGGVPSHARQLGGGGGLDPISLSRNTSIAAAGGVSAADAYSLQNLMRNPSIGGREAVIQQLVDEKQQLMSGMGGAPGRLSDPAYSSAAGGGLGRALSASLGRQSSLTQSSVNVSKYSSLLGLGGAGGFGHAPANAHAPNAGAASESAIDALTATINARAESMAMNNNLNRAESMTLNSRSDSIGLAQAIQEAMRFLGPVNLDSAESLGPTPLRPGVSTTLAQMKMAHLLNGGSGGSQQAAGPSAPINGGSGTFAGENKRVYWVPPADTVDDMNPSTTAALNDLQRQPIETGASANGQIGMTKMQRGDTGGSLDDLCRAAGMYLGGAGGAEGLKPGKTDSDLVGDSEYDDGNTGKPADSRSYTETTRPTRQKSGGLSRKMEMFKGSGRNKKDPPSVKSSSYGWALAQEWENVKVVSARNAELKVGKNDNSLLDDEDDDDKPIAGLGSKRKLEQQQSQGAKRQGTVPKKKKKKSSTPKSILNASNQSGGGEAPATSKLLDRGVSFSRIKSLPITETSLETGHSLAMSEISLDRGPSFAAMTNNNSKGNAGGFGSDPFGGGGDGQFDDASEDEEEGCNANMLRGTTMGTLHTFSDLVSK